jgi:hypothetical protein
MLVFSYHKSGTSLFARVMPKVADALGLRLGTQYGMVWDIDARPDICLLPHSLLASGIGRPYRAIRVVRDPRDIWVSGYLYHRHTNEPWCINTNFDPTPPIRVPRVDYAFQHRPERWKRRYLAALGGKSYQQNLLDRDRDAGLAFELAGYTGCTLDAMRAWRLAGPDVLDVRLEDFSGDYDGAMLTAFRHLGFTAAECEAAIPLARSEDIARMDDAAIASRPQIHSRDISKWRAFLTAGQVAQFEALYGDLIVGLGYRLARDCPSAEAPVA